MPDQERVPEGVTRYDCDHPRTGEHGCEARMVPWENGDWIKVSDIPAIRQEVLEEVLQDPEFWARFKAQLPPAVRPSTINCIVAARAALSNTPSTDKPADALSVPDQSSDAGLREKFAARARDNGNWHEQRGEAENAIMWRSYAEALEAAAPSDTPTQKRCGGSEDCGRCGRGNASWSASSPLWNAVMRGGSIEGEPKFDDLVCASCFMELAEEQGVASQFYVSARQVNVELETTTPSGRIWDEGQRRWVEPNCQQPTQEQEGSADLTKQLCADLPEAVANAALNRLGGTVKCNCASVPPTMPTCRDKHLPTCPVAREEAWLAELIKCERSLAFARARADQPTQEDRLVEVEREREELRELAVLNGGAAAEQAERADQAEAKLGEMRAAVDRVVAYLDTACDDPEDWPGPCDNAEHTRRPDSDDWICERCNSSWWALNGDPAPLHSRIAAFLRNAPTDHPTQKRYSVEEIKQVMLGDEALEQGVRSLEAEKGAHQRHISSASLQRAILADLNKAFPLDTEEPSEDCDDLCTCGHVRHEHRYFPDPECGPETGGCADSGCEKFVLDTEEGS